MLRPLCLQMGWGSFNPMMVMGNMGMGGMDPSMMGVSLVLGCLLLILR